MAGSSPTPTLDDVLDRAAARALEVKDLEQAASRQRATLRAMTSHDDRLQALAQGTVSPANPALVELLLEEARGRIDDLPDEAHELAELAEAAALRLSGGRYGPDFCRDRLIEARGCRANALRACGHLPQAEELLREVVLATYDSCDPFLIAEVAVFAASFAQDRHRLEDALACLDEAERWFLALGASSDVLARVRRQRASVVALRGEPGAAVDGVVEVLRALGAGAASEPTA